MEDNNIHESHPNDGRRIAKLKDGRILTFPKGTTDDAVSKAVREVMFTPPAPPPKISAAPKEQRFGEALGEAVAEEGPQTLGGIAGGLAASAIPPLIPLGVGLGAATGESLKQIGQHLSGSPDAPQSKVEAAKRMGIAGATEAGFEIVGGLAMKTAGKILSPFKKRVTEGFDEVVTMFKDKIKPIVLLPAEATDSRTLDLLNNISEASIIGGNKIADYKRNRTKFFEEYADSIIGEFGKRRDPADLGDLFVTALDHKQKLHSEASEVLYNNVKDLLGTKTKQVPVTRTVPVEGGIVGGSGEQLTREITELVDIEVSPVEIPTTEWKEFAKKRLKLGRAVSNIDAAQAGDDLMRAIVDLPDKISFDAASELRTRMINRVDEFKIIQKDAGAVGKAKKVLTMIHDDVAGELKREGNEPALKAWDTARNFYKDGQEQFNNRFLRRMIKMADETGTGAENIAPSIFKPKQISNLKKVKSALGENSKEWHAMKRFFIEHLFQKSSSTASGDVVGQKVVRNLSNSLTGFGKPVLDEVFSPEELKRITTFGRYMQLAQAKQGEGAGRMLIQLAQGGALGGMLNEHTRGVSTAILFGPTILTRMLLNPKMAKLLTTGISTPAVSKEAAGLLTRLTAAATRIKMEMDKEQ